MAPKATILAILLFCATPLFQAQSARGQSSANTWTTLVESEVNPRGGAGLVWHSKLKRFVLFDGLESHEFTGNSGYNVQSLYLKESAA
jgi:hypothetical protein